MGGPSGSPAPAGRRLDFTCIGAQRSGTTWLYHNLKQHPDIRLPAKELHFWDRREQSPGDYPVEKYLDYLATPKLAGDITPAYAILQPDTVSEICEWFPALKVIYLLRNPLRRSWSAALLHAGHLDLDPATLDDSWFLEFFQDEGHRRRSDYVSAIRNWSRFDLVIRRYEELGSELLSDLFGFLGVPPHRSENTDRVFVHYGKGVGNRRSTVGPRVNLFEPLLEQHREMVVELQDVIGQDLSTWLTREAWLAPLG